MDASVIQLPMALQYDDLFQLAVQLVHAADDLRSLARDAAHEPAAAGVAREPIVEFGRRWSYGLGQLAADCHSCADTLGVIVQTFRDLEDALTLVTP